MSKDFEQAYRELAQTEVPDLWDRIEAGLSEKSAPAAFKIDKAVKEKETEELKGADRKIFIFMRRYSAVAAALVCVAILIPAISLIGEFGIGGSKSEEAIESAQEPAAMWEEAADEAPAEMAVVTEESMEETAGYVEEEAAEEMAVEAAAEESVDEAPEAEYAEDMNAANAENVKETADVEMADGVRTEAARAEKYQEEQGLSEAGSLSLPDRCPEGTVVRDVQIKVLEVSDMMKYFENSDREDLGCICTVEVQKQPEGLLTEGEQIDIFISGYSSIALMKNGVYKLDLESFVSKEECYFEIKKYHRQLEP